MTRLEILVADDAHVVATWGRTLMVIWRGPPSTTSSARVNELARAFLGASPLPSTSLWVVEAKSRAPDDATRQNFAQYSRDIVSEMKMAVVVAEGGGFRGALVRAVGVALSSILPHRSRFKFVDDVKDATELLGPHLLPGAGGPEALFRAATEARAHIASA